MRHFGSLLSAIRHRRVAVTAAVAVAVACLATVAKSGTVGAAIMLAALAVAAGVLRQLGQAEASVRRWSGLGPRARLGEALAAVEAKVEAGADRQSRVHPVTGIATREPLAETINADIAAAAGERLLGAIRLVDYDRLAAFDLEAANQALTGFGARLTGAAKSDVAVAQIDRDTFALWFRAGGDAAAEFRAIVYVAGQDLEGLAAPLSPTVEAAAVHYPVDGLDAANLFVRVTSALNVADRSSTGMARVAAAQPADTARSQFMLEQDLNHAIDDGQLKMMFQPVFDIGRGRLIGAEALLRWDHPQLGSVSPARFIPIVEASGLSDRYGLWVLNAACREARLWRDEGHADLKVAVNLSARQLNDADLKDKIERTLRRHDLDPVALELELTETAAMSEAERTFALFGALRAIGVSLAIDDFGSGYSSMSYLKNLPFDKLKIDREFITDVDSRRDSRAICRALIELGRGLDLLVLAEGVETPAEVKTLHALGCNVFQGYYFSKPLSGENFRRLAADPHRSAPSAAQLIAIS